MAYVLRSDMADAQDDLQVSQWKWQQYRDYLESVRGRMPSSAFAFASALWHLRFR